MTTTSDGLQRLLGWFDDQRWTPHPFQARAWTHQLAGRDGLINVPTGSGKTLAAYIGALARVLDAGQPRGLQILYITPLRALTRDIEAALRAPVEQLGLNVRVESRTGDTSSSVKKRQRTDPPEILVTTPESLSLMLSYATAPDNFTSLRALILDEWHAICSSKRGVLAQLSAARLRRLNPSMQTWALSATVADLQATARDAAGVGSEPVIVRDDIDRPIALDMLSIGAFGAYPWGGEDARRIVEAVAEAIDATSSSMVFTNTRTMAEHWYQGLLEARPEWAGALGLHHGSLDRKERAWVERALKAGELRAVVSTSSLDLGLDLEPVDRVFQIGSPKRIDRMIQRAGRASHSLGQTCRLTCVPTRPMEAVEVAALRHALSQGALETPRAPERPYDVLAQHLITCALGGGWHDDAMFEEVRAAPSYAALTRQEFDWVVDLLERGGATLQRYPDYHKLDRDGDTGACVVTDRTVAQRHRMSIGTITSSATVKVRFLKGKRLGHIDERYVSRLRPGDQFVFAGRALELVRLHELTAYVRLASGAPKETPTWDGARLPLSAPLAGAMLEVLAREARQDERPGPELEAARSILTAQRRLSALPTPELLLAERIQDRQGHHLLLFPFAGQLVHEGLAALLALRMTRMQEATFSLSASEYGLGLTCPEPFPFEDALADPALLTEQGWVEDALESVNVGELARRRFRGIARVSGLVFSGYPGSRKTRRQLQTSAGLLHDVFAKYDPDNLLLAQARREVLDEQFERARLTRALAWMRGAELVIEHPPRPTPLGFPLLLERRGATISNESLRARIERMKQSWLKTSQG